jgi:hypothetical protein
MSETIASQATEANDARNIKDPQIGWMIGFLFLVSFVGLFALVPLRKVNLRPISAFLRSYSIPVYPSILWIYDTHACAYSRKNLLIVSNHFLVQIMIVDYKLTYPSGTATAYLINGFHTPEGAKLAK